MDSLPDFPRNAVHSDTEALLTSEIETGSGEPRPYGRPESWDGGLFIKITIPFSQPFKNQPKSFLQKMIDTALILAGGLGTRLRPLTDQIPKPLLLVRGKPILQHALENLARHGVRNIILSIGYRAEQVQEFFGDGSALGVHITYAIEEEPLGTGGAVLEASASLRKPFFLIWGDNLMDIDLTDMYKTYLRQAAQITMALTPREDVEHFGVARLEGEKIMQFVEKPRREEAPSTLINAGAFIIDPTCLRILPAGKSSIEKDCFEKLAPLGEVGSFIHRGYWLPTDTLEKYDLACTSFQPKIDFSKKKVIIADVDETICESCQQISPEMATEINRLIRKGYSFAFISGTKCEDLQQMISPQLKEEHHLLATTGTKYAHIHNGFSKVCYNHSFTKEEKEEIMNAFEQLIQQFDIRSHTSKEDQLQDRDSQITLSAIGRHALSEMKAAYDPDGTKRKVWVEFLKQQLGDKYDIKIGGTTSIDVTRKGLNKEWGIREFARYHGYALSQILFLGDKLYPGGNDHPATRIVDCIAVKNPQETLGKLKLL